MDNARPFPASSLPDRQWLHILLMGILVISSIGCDQITKNYFERHFMVWSHDTDLTLYQGWRQTIFELGDPTAPMSDTAYLSLGINYVRNQGAAWGALSNLPDNIRSPFFFAVTIVAIVVLGIYFRSTPPGRHVARFSLMLILSGAIGNFLNRVFLGYVIDWIDVRWQIFGWRYDFPNFNWADCAITIGVAVLMFDTFVSEWRARPPRVRQEP